MVKVKPKSSQLFLCSYTLFYNFFRSFLRLLVVGSRCCCNKLYFFLFRTCFKMQEMRARQRDGIVMMLRRLSELISDWQVFNLLFSWSNNFQGVSWICFFYAFLRFFSEYFGDFCQIW